MAKDKEGGTIVDDGTRKSDSWKTGMNPKGCPMDLKRGAKVPLGSELADKIRKGKVKS